MKVPKRGLTLMLLGWFMSFIAGCSADVSPVALQGISPSAASVVGSSDLSQWSTKLAANTSIYFVKTKLESGELEYRAYLRTGNDESTARYLGALTHELPEAPLVTLMFDVDGDRFIVGRIDDRSVDGTLDSIEFLRPEPNQAKWMEGVKLSTLKDQFFVIPIGQAEAPTWTQLERVSILTKESLKALGAEVDQAKAENRAATPQMSAWEHTYQPPLDISPLFARIP